MVEATAGAAAVVEITSPVDGETIFTPFPTISGTAEAGVSDITVFSDSELELAQLYGRASVIDGVWSCDAQSGLIGSGETVVTAMVGSLITPDPDVPQHSIRVTVATKVEFVYPTPGAIVSPTAQFEGRGGAPGTLLQVTGSTSAGPGFQFGEAPVGDDGTWSFTSREMPPGNAYAYVESDGSVDTVTFIVGGADQ